MRYFRQLYSFAQWQRIPRLKREKVSLMIMGGVDSFLIDIVFRCKTNLGLGNVSYHSSKDKIMKRY